METVLTMASRPSRAADGALAALLGRSAAGDEVALAELYRATSAYVFGVALRILRDRPLAEEATVEVYTQVWRQGDRYDPGRGGVLAWILTLARTRAIDLLRTKTRWSRRELALDPDLPVADPAPGPAELSEEADRAARVRRALDALPPEQRRCLETAFFSGLTHREVAAALGQPLGTVKTRIRRGLMTLRQLLSAAEEGMA